MNQDDDSLSSDQLLVTLPANLLAQIDALVGGEFIDREDFIRAAVRRYLEYMQETQTRRSATDIG